MTLEIPSIDPDTDTLTAALKYAEAGLYVGPVKRGTKHPGSVLGGGWQALTSRDADVLASWFAGTDYGVFIHAGRSGLVIADVDTPANLHPLLRRAVDELAPPFQTTREGDAERGHYLFAQPAGRMLGNSLGGLASGWGELRGHNGVIIVAPSVHEDEGGLYQWQRVGPVPEFPAYCAEQVGDAMPSEAAASDAQVAAFLKASTQAERPELVGIHASAFRNAVERGESRHQTMTGHLAGAMREAAAGLVPAQAAADTLESVFREAVTAPPTSGKQGDPRGTAQARSEWRGLLAWAVAQAEGSDPQETRARVAERVPDVDAQVRELVGTAGVNTLAPDSGGRDLPPADDAGRDALGSSWAAQDLAETVAGVLSGTITRPAPTVGRRSDGQALFYRGKVNGVAGSSNAGKSWTGFHTCAQELACGEHVVYVDLEDDMAAAVARLLDLGVDPEVIPSRFHYIAPDEMFTAEAAVHLFALIDQVGPSVVVIDSTGESLALDGAKPNDDDEVARWFRRLPTAVARRSDAAVVVLDHTTKAEDGGLWPIGSQRKRAAISGAQFMQVNVRPFDRQTAGFSKLVCAKDRHGNYHQNQVVALLHVTPGPSGVDLELGTPQETGTSGVGTWRPTGIMEKVSRLLEAADEPLSVSKIEKRAGVKKGNALTVAVRTLITDGYVTTEDGPRSAILHTSVRPYRQDGDPLSDTFRGAGDGQAPDDPPEPPCDRPRPRDGGRGTVTHTVPGGRSGDGGGRWDGRGPEEEESAPDELPCATCGEPLEPRSLELGLADCLACREGGAA